MGQIYIYSLHGHIRFGAIIINEETTFFIGVLFVWLLATTIINKYCFSLSIFLICDYSLYNKRYYTHNHRMYIPNKNRTTISAWRTNNYTDRLLRGGRRQDNDARGHMDDGLKHNLAVIELDQLKENIFA